MHVPILVRDVYVVCDGQPHGIAVEGLLPSDTVEFSTDRETWQKEEILYTQPGEYTVHVRVKREGYIDSVTFGNLYIFGETVDGITAKDVRVVYDGEKHGITVNGVEAGDKVQYSDDGREFKEEEITKEEPGRYTIYYRVVRGTGYYSSSAQLCIIPDIYGCYIRSNGIIEIDEDTYFDETGTGRDFYVKGDILVSAGLEYKKANGNVYCLEIGDRVLCACSKEDIPLSVTFDGGATITLGDESVKLPEYNYCEEISGIELDRDIVCSDIYCTLSPSGKITKVTVRLSQRDTISVTARDVYIFADGNEHGVYPDTTGTLLVKQAGRYTEEIPTYTEPGRYTYEYAVISEGKLPATAVCLLVIYPPLDGTYYTPTSSVYIRGNSCLTDGKSSEVVCGLDGIKIDGMTVTVSSDGIILNGTEYTKTDRRIVSLTYAGKRRVYETDGDIYILQTDGEIILFDRAEWSEDNVLPVPAEDSILCVLTETATVSSVTVNGNEVASLSSDGKTVYMIGAFDYVSVAEVRIG